MRDFEVADLKEEYDKISFEDGLVTAEEYQRIPASTNMADERRRMRDTTYLMTQVVGCEVPEMYKR